MAALGELVVKLSANTAEFTRAMDKAAWQSQKKMDEMLKMADRVGQLIGGTLVASAGAMAVAMDRVVNRADEMGKLAAIAGDSVARFSEMTYAAERHGVAADKLADIYKDVQDKVGDFVQNGGGPMKDFFDNIAPKVGVTADQFRRLGGSEALQLYFNSLQKANLAQSDLVFYMEAIASDSTKLIPLLRDGGQGFNTAAEEARAYGLTLSEEVVAGATAVNDNLRRMGAIQEGLLTQYTASLLPTMEAVTAEMVRYSQSSDLAVRAAKATTVLFQTLAVVGSDVAFVFKMTTNEVEGMLAQLAALGHGDFKGFSAIRQMMIADSAAARAELDSFQTRIMAIGTTAVEVAQKAEAADSGGGPFGPVIRSAKAAKKTVDAAVKAQQDLQREAQRVFEATRTPAEQLASEYDRLNRLLDAGAISWDTYGRAVMAAQEQLMPMAAEAEKAERQIAQIEKTIGGVEMVISNAFGNMGDALAEFAMGGKVSFTDLVNTMVKDLIRFQAQAAMTGLFNGGSGGGGLVGSLVSGLAGWAGAASGVTYGTNAGSQQSMMLASQDFGLRANGGMVQAGQSYLVGERGPELLTLGSVSGNITPNSALGGGASFTVNVINNGDGQARTEKRSDGRGGTIIDVIVERAKNAVAADIGSGNGAVPAAMQGAYGLNRRAGAY